ncbi:TPA: helix-turn-helix domain-containing protein [Pseudomonas aeruginosa]
MQALTRWLRDTRMDQGLTMRDLGERLGVTHSYVQKVETGERRLDVVEYVWYCAALGAAPHEGLDLVKAFASQAGENVS